MITSIKNYRAQTIKWSTKPTNGQTINFVNDNFVDESFPDFIESFSSNQISKDPNNSGNNVISANGLTGITLTIADGSTQKVYEMPATALNRSTNNGQTQPLNGIKINLQKSFITIVDNTNINANECFVLGIGYKGDV